MALRRILTKEDPMLYKNCRPVTDFNPRLHELLDDLKDTLLKADGVGLAAPQVGILRRVAIVIETNVPAGEEEKIIELINPQIVNTAGDQTGAEGCLSAPGEYGIVERPMDVTVRAQDRYGKWFEVSGTGLTARCFCHELDHLDGHMFLEKCQRMLSDEELSGGEDED